MRYLILAVIPFAMFIFISCTFAQSSETEALKNKVEMFEKELKEIKRSAQAANRKRQSKGKGDSIIKGKDCSEGKRNCITQGS